MGDVEDHELLIILNVKIDSILEALKQVPALEIRVRNVETDTAKLKADMENNTGSIKSWNIINSIGVVIAAISGFLLK